MFTRKLFLSGPVELVFIVYKTRRLVLQFKEMQVNLCVMKFL